MAPDTDDSSPGAEAREAPAQPSPASLKVELDIEDAPFLDDPEEEKPAPEPEPEAPGEVPLPSGESRAEEPGKGRFAALLANKKRLALVVGGAVFVILVLPLALLVLFAGEDPPIDPLAAGPTRLLAPTPVREDAPPGPRFTYKAESFFLERRGSEGEIRFLRCRFSIPTDDENLYRELTAKTIVVRDAIYYYLSNRPLIFLNNPETNMTLKQDLISVINEHVASAKIQELFIEEYLVTSR